MSEDRLEKAKAVMRERAVTPMMRDALPLASKVQEFFYGIRAEEKHDYATLIELCKGMQDLDQSILALVEEKKPHGDDEKFYVTWLHNFQTDIFRNWVMKLGYEIAELEQATQRFSSRVDLELAEPRSGYGQVKFAYESQLKKAKPLIDQYYDILKLKVFLLPSKRVETLRPPPDEVEQTIAKIDRLKANSIEAIRLSLDRMRELYIIMQDRLPCMRSSRRCTCAGR